MQVKLKVITGSHEGKEIDILTDKFLIGRSESCQLRPKSESVSRKHCILVIKENRLLIQDLKSRNGTYVNDQRLPADRAKILRGGDQLRIGKLQFEIVIEHGLQARKKPEVADMGDAAARTVEAGSSDSRCEAVDVNAWLDEADQIDRVRKLSDPETRQFRIDKASSDEESSDGTGTGTGDEQDSTDLSVDESTSTDVKSMRKERKKKGPGKLPDNFQRDMTDNSREAADDALKRFFSGR